VRGAWINNLRGLDADIPKGVLVCVAGAAGSGKSSLVLDVFAREHPEAVIVDQSAIGRSSRGNCATYLGAFDPMRKEMAKALGLEASLLSFNSKGGCPKCGGSGFLSVEMSFLDDVRMNCDECNGSRYREEVLSHRYRGKNVAEILELTATEAAPFFDSPEVRRRLGSLAEVGLGYLSIGQSLSSLSGGEAQRLKLAAELHKSGNIYILDEPSSGLHVADTARLLFILDRLVGAGNSVIVIEHNLEVIAAADWVIDMGPGGGAEGGRILAAGRPEDIAADPGSITGPYLRPLLGLAAPGPSVAARAAAV
jgi:excinuclease ABC A subunit